jgi:hypothetical protein
MNKLINILKDIRHEIDHFLNAMVNKILNISLKFSPYDLDLKLITRFSVGDSFEKACNPHEENCVKSKKLSSRNVLSLEDVIASKIKSSRLKDLLDTQK